MSAHNRPRARSLLIRLLVAYLLPALALLALFGWQAYRVTARSLEQSLGRRLIGIAQAAATQIRPRAILFLSPGDEQSRTGRRVRHKLQQLKKRTGVARLLVLDRDFRSRADTRDGVHIGDRYYQAEADEAELQRVFGGAGASSVLFVGADGVTYKTGYAPVLDQDGKVVAALGVAGSATFFTVLASLRNTLLLSGAVVAILMMLVSVLVARRITRPLRTLAREAERIGAGDLESPIAPGSRDEVGLLAQTMNEMRKGLFQRDQQMQMMLSGIAHEVRNPLGGIELFSGILRDELEGDEEKIQHVERIERELTYLKRVVEEFLDFARHPKPTLANVDLGPLLDEVIELLAKDAGDRDVTLLRSGEGEVLAMCDLDQIRRVLINLIRNAIQATPAQGRVVLRCIEVPAGAAVEVEDDGPGMAPDTLDQIFTPFFTTREKGTGLGLAFVKKIVEDHEGALTVDSEPGRGATFRVTLPPAASGGGGDPGEDGDQ